MMREGRFPNCRISARNTGATVHSPWRRPMVIDPWYDSGATSPARKSRIRDRTDHLTYNSK